MQKLYCVRTIQQSSASLDFLSQDYQPVSPSILSHFQWELYQEGIKDKYKIQVKLIRCDNTGENKKLEEKCDAEGLGIIIEYTATVTPQQNAYVERAFPTLMGRSRAMMNFAGFTTGRKPIWCRPANIATVLDNIWCMNLIVNLPTLCFMEKMPKMPSICDHVVKFVSQQTHPTK